MPGRGVASTRRGKRKGDLWKVPDHICTLIAGLLLTNVTIKLIAFTFGVHRRTVERINNNLIAFGTPHNLLRHERGTKRKLDEAILNHLILYLDDRPTAYLDEMCWFLWDIYGIALDPTTVSRALQRRGWSRKVTRRRALEASDSARAEWLERRRGWKQMELVFIDESAAHERTGDRKYGWSPVGQSPLEISSFHRFERWSILPALSLTGYIRPLVYHGDITSEIFAAWLQEEVLPRCNQYVEGQHRENSIIVMDNCRIHKTKVVQDVLIASGVRVEFLPPYSPDFNPIEIDFAVLKSAIRRHYDLAADQEFGLFLQWTCQQFGGKHAEKQFEHCGYVEV